MLRLLLKEIRIVRRDTFSCHRSFAEDVCSATSPSLPMHFHRRRGDDSRLLLLFFYQIPQTAFLAICNWFCLNSIFCNCFLALERLDFEVPAEMPSCPAISS